MLTNTAVKGVQEYKPDSFNAEATFAELSNGEKMPFGALVWSAGLAPVKFTEALDNGIFERSKRGCRLLVDERLQIPGQEGTIWALGDAALCSVRPLPPIAQAAQQQAKYIAKALNAEGAYHAPLSASSGSNPAEGAEQQEMAARAAALEKAKMPFTFFQLGAMSQLGLGEGVPLNQSRQPTLPRVSFWGARLGCCFVPRYTERRVRKKERRRKGRQHNPSVFPLDVAADVRSADDAIACV